MATEKEDNNVCMRCKVDSQQVVLLAAERRGEEQYICVRCLPYLIHGEE